jgi:two-component system, OmpR family, response regulator
MKILTILVVDDDPVIRRLLQQRLKKESYNVLVAADGYKAQSILHEKHVDVVLTDLMMPGDIGGIEVTEIAKNINRNIEVILITAHSSVDTAVEAMKKGASDYLEKPINFDELFLRLDKIANVQTMFRSAQELQHAMDVTEHAASETIQALEMKTAELQGLLDDVENILRDEHSSEELRITQALDKISRM